MPATFRCLYVAVAALLLALPLPAHAQLDLTRRAGEKRAGPDAAFPMVMRLPAGSGVHVAGCLVGREWCDVQSGRTRGWMRLQDLPQTPHVRDAPTVTFSVAEYWDAHYTRRSWYAQREQWLAWGTPGFQPPASRAR